jgi:hypothetical protein
VPHPADKGTQTDWQGGHCSARRFICNLALEHSVQIRLGKRERISDQFDTRFPIIHDNDLHNVESKKNIGII